MPFCIMKERLQKILSARSICSRRKAEEYIQEGLVRVNGKVAHIGDKADPESDNIEVDGKVLDAKKDFLYYVMYKPVGVITSNVEGDREVLTVRGVLPKNLQGKIYPIGRLDKDSEGLLLFTNDGTLANRLLHPKFDHEKEYAVTTFRPITDGQMNKLERGITISGTKTKPSHVRRIDPLNFTIVLTEGRNRQIRRMCQKVGCPVKFLKRIVIVTLKDSHLWPGQVRQLTNKECSSLLNAVGLLV